mmetsp:Transcript_3674/g.5144  ORF Transcript_3674/g.5144 Transcript_3674/m.5144 type:complete len:132 (+) Transcript_3674:132-527(+)|eukprot:CAMPEP_0194783342 /NCGR_PEP_ID=MMETSP0323_2-20130528/79169_1 /TAXON_ID=2866 ORGANISM="Crypthecodinium cohnii, Strain Seligo" /NCGR_SAMPLE_ID=MMETSP0323_2 /ASSEMBLY_ACC=CAM_ASM_000346 /LENGTH=131 /DNA_ID=CAMNT_0039722211 /DNA_START=668 /DNA_END=1063 /DNA_ORIENTATION=-
MTQALKPDPQLSITAAVSAALDRSSPNGMPRDSRTLSSSSNGCICPPGQAVTNSVKGMFLPPGICPFLLPGRGSSAVPAKRPEDLASNIKTLLVSKFSKTLSIAQEAATLRSHLKSSLVWVAATGSPSSKG